MQSLSQHVGLYLCNEEATNLLTYTVTDWYWQIALLMRYNSLVTRKLKEAFNL